MKLESWDSDNGDEGEVVARRRQPPFSRQREIDRLGRSELRSMSLRTLAFRVLAFGRTRGEEEGERCGQVVVVVRSFPLRDPTSHELVIGAELLGSSKDPRNAVGRVWRDFEFKVTLVIG